MILVRDVFRLKFGKARDARALMKEAGSMMPADMQKRSRTLFDLTGPAYTLVWEMTTDSLSAWEKEMAEGMSEPGWREWYQKFVPLVDHSYREIFTIEA